MILPPMAPPDPLECPRCRSQTTKENHARVCLSCGWRGGTTTGP